MCVCVCVYGCDGCAYLDPLPVESDIPVCQLTYELYQSIQCRVDTLKGWRNHHMTAM